jgi:superfamily II DNA/RNA helicase
MNQKKKKKKKTTTASFDQLGFNDKILKNLSKAGYEKSSLI